jgi:signal transduction histidine kinase
MRAGVKLTGGGALDPKMEPHDAKDIGWIVDDLPTPVCVAAVPDGHVVYFNRAYERLLTIGEKEGVGAPLTSTERPFGARARHLERLAVAQVVAARQSLVLDELLHCREGAEDMQLRVHAQPIFDSARQLTHVSIALVAVTEQAKPTGPSDTFEARLALVTEHAPIVSWALDDKGVITASEGAGLAALGVKSGELVGRNVFDLCAAYPSIVAPIRQALAGASSAYTAELPDAVYETWLRPIRNAEGAILGVVGLSNDTRELRQLQALSIQNDRVMALGTLAASVAHEINNPITYILVHAEQVGRALGKLDAIAAEVEGSHANDLKLWLGRLAEHFGTMKNGTERIASITRELRTFSRPDDNGLESIDIRRVVHSVLQLVGKKLETRARLSIDLQETAPVEANPARLVQVVLNLVMNAMQALPAGFGIHNEISVRTFGQGDRAFIEVADTGPGVPPADRERIFYPFVTTKATADGTGLGLFVCRNIVRGYSGNVSVEDRPGGGALFRVELPATPGARARPAPAAPAPVPASTVAPAHERREHILVIDDDPLVARALCLRLRQAGYRTSRDADGAAGLRRLLAKGDIDLVFCDLLMGGMSGMDFFEALQAQAPHQLQKLVFMTGGAFTPSARQLAIEQQGRVVEKPFDIVQEADRRLEELNASSFEGADRLPRQAAPNGDRDAQ